MRKRKLFGTTLLLIAVAAVSSCTKTNSDTGNLYVPANSDVTANATLADLQQGRSIYVSKCNSCHGLYSPDSYSVNQWKQILSSMAPKAGLSSSENQLVTKYVCRGKQ